MCKLKSKGRYACLLAATLVTAAAWGDSFFYVGPEASADGATLIGRTVEPERMNAAFRTVVRPNVVEREMAYASTPAVSAIRRRLGWGPNSTSTSRSPAAAVCPTTGSVRSC